MSPPFSLRPLPPSDAPSVARIFQAAFANEHIMRHFYPRTPEEAKWEMDVRFFEGLLRKCDGGEIGSEGGSGEYGIYGGGWLAFLRMVVREMDMGMAFSKWDYPHTLTEKQKERKRKKQMEDKLKRCVEGSNEGLMKEFYQGLAMGRERWLDGKGMFFLHLLAVDPAYQRRGLGSMLIQPGLEAADKAGKKTYIEATPDGLELYLKHGWVVVDELVLDMGKFGVVGGEVERMPFLIREVVAKENEGGEGRLEEWNIVGEERGVGGTCRCGLVAYVPLIWN